MQTVDYYTTILGAQYYKYRYYLIKSSIIYEK